MKIKSILTTKKPIKKKVSLYVNISSSENTFVFQIHFQTCPLFCWDQPDADRDVLSS